MVTPKAKVEKSKRPSYLEPARSEYWFVKPCAWCGRQVLRGWDDGKFSVQLELTPVTPIGEALAVLAGLMTYWIRPTRGGAICHWRSPANMWADAHRPRPMVLPEHLCKEYQDAHRH